MKKQPGKKLDKDVEEKIFKRMNTPDKDLPLYSQDINKAWDIVDDIVKKAPNDAAKYNATIIKHVQDARMPAHAITLTCLEILGFPVEE